MMRKVLLVMSLFSLGLIGCAGGPTPIPDAGSAAAQLYAQKCGACHAVPHPQRNTADDWRHLVALMEQRMAERAMPRLTDEQLETIMNYLHANAR